MSTVPFTGFFATAFCKPIHVDTHGGVLFWEWRQFRGDDTRRDNSCFLPRAGPEAQPSGGHATAGASGALHAQRCFEGCNKNEAQRGPGQLDFVHHWQALGGRTLARTHRVNRVGDAGEQEEQGAWH